MKQNLGQIFRSQAQKLGNHLAVSKRLEGVWHDMTWNEYYQAAKEAGLGLYALGIQKGDKISLLSQNRLEWVIADMGIICTGGVTIPIYPTVPASEAGYINSNSDAVLYIAEDKKALGHGLATLKDCPQLKKMVIINTQGISMNNEMLMSFDELRKTGRQLDMQEPGLFDQLIDAVEPQDLATFVYTSGTTGHPKGAMITHRNILAVIDSLNGMQWADETDVAVAFLPLCHVFQRVAGHFFAMSAGVQTYYSEDFNSIVEDIQSRRPTVLLAVPRICEKIYARILTQAKEQAKWKQSLFNWAVSVGARYSQLKEKHAPIPALLEMQYAIAYKMVFQKLRDALGGRLRWMVAAGAPLAREIADFFNAAQIFLIEGYGMTECSAPVTLNRLDEYKFGTAGRPLTCNQIKIADDGEILIKGDNVIQGYWKMPEQTKEAFTDDGWFMSGDIGHLDKDGYLIITDRKKDLIITAGGKNIAPQNIENLFKQDPLFEQAIVIGDNRKYLVALFNLNLDESARLAKQAGIDFDNPEELFDKAEFKHIVDSHMERCNQNLARVETIKHYRILKNPFSEANGELTPSLKVKRKVVMHKYKDVIDSMYTAAEM